MNESYSDHQRHFQFYAKCLPECPYCEVGYRIDSLGPLSNQTIARRATLHPDWPPYSHPMLPEYAWDESQLNDSLSI